MGTQLATTGLVFPFASLPKDSMSDTNAEKARAYMHKLLAAMSEAGGSDLFIANDFPPA